LFDALMSKGHEDAVWLDGWSQSVLSRSAAVATVLCL